MIKIYQVNKHYYTNGTHKQSIAYSHVTINKNEAENYAMFHEGGLMNIGDKPDYFEIIETDELSAKMAEFYLDRIEWNLLDTKTIAHIWDLMGRYDSHDFIQFHKTAKGLKKTLDASAGERSVPAVREILQWNNWYYQDLTDKELTNILYIALGGDMHKVIK